MKTLSDAVDEQRQGCGDKESAARNHRYHCQNSGKGRHSQKDRFTKNFPAHQTGKLPGLTETRLSPVSATIPNAIVEKDLLGSYTSRFCRITALSKLQDKML